MFFQTYRDENFIYIYYVFAQHPNNRLFEKFSTHEYQQSYNHTNNISAIWRMKNFCHPHLYAAENISSKCLIICGENFVFVFVVNVVVQFFVTW